MSIYELENLFEDPDYFIEECFMQIENAIDVYAEEGKLKEPENADKFNEEREELFKELNKFQEMCKQVAKNGLFTKEMDKIKEFMTTFDPKKTDSKEKLEENIKEMKAILLRFHSYSFVCVLDK